MFWLVWVGFFLFIVTMVLLDLGVLHRKAKVISFPEALAWTSIWITLAILFNIFVYFLYAENWLGWSNMYSHQLTGQQAVIQFFTGYLVELSLSVDNIFVIAMVFAYFHVPLAEQHRVLFWGILGAVILRCVMIVGGLILIEKFDWITYLFGAFLLLSATKMLIVRHDNFEPEKNFIVQLTQKFYPVTSEFDGSRFFTFINGRRAATPLFLALILVETSDIMFAIDSIPAIFAITRDPFLVFTSNIFAILGLRSMYFVLASLMDRFRYLKMSLVFLLVFVGVKMLLVHHYQIPNLISLAFIGGILSIGILGSIIAGSRDTAALISPLVDELEEIALIGYRQAKRVAILLLGSSVMLIGIAMIILPGPASIVIPIGLSILALEFYWARRWLVKIRKNILRAKNYVTNKTK